MTCFSDHSFYGQKLGTACRVQAPPCLSTRTWCDRRFPDLAGACAKGGGSGVIASGGGGGGIIWGMFPRGREYRRAQPVTIQGGGGTSPLRLLFLTCAFPYQSGINYFFSFLSTEETLGQRKRSESRLP